MASEAEKIMSEALHQWHRLPREHWAKHCPSTFAFLAVLQTSEEKSPWECAQEIPIFPEEARFKVVGQERVAAGKFYGFCCHQGGWNIGFCYRLSSAATQGIWEPKTPVRLWTIPEIGVRPGALTSLLFWYSILGSWKCQEPLDSSEQWSHPKGFPFSGDSVVTTVIQSGSPETLLTLAMSLTVSEVSVTWRKRIRQGHHVRFC